MSNSAKLDGRKQRCHLNSHLDKKETAVAANFERLDLLQFGGGTNQKASDTVSTPDLELVETNSGRRSMDEPLPLQFGMNGRPPLGSPGSEDSSATSTPIEAFLDEAGNAPNDPGSLEMQSKGMENFMALTSNS